MKTKLFYLLMCLFAFTAINAQINSVAIVGAGIEPNGWPGDPANPGPTDKYQMTRVPGTDDWTYLGLVMAGGEFKFRANNSWDSAASTPPGGNWGKPLTGPSFPTGIGAENAGGSKNIVAIAGTYDVSFNSVTGNYSFTGGAPIPVVKLIGTATGAGTGIIMDPTGTDTYALPANTVLVAGNAQFEVDGTVVGALAFPSGTATGVATDFIPVTAGKYTSVTYNNASLAYVFTPAPLYDEIGLIGSGTTGTQAGWSADIAKMTTTDGIIYTLKNQQLYSVNSNNPDAGGPGIPGPGPGEVKFRTYGAWTQDWGGGSFPFGPIEGNNGNIGVTADGVYDIIFNKTTKVYRFNLSSQPPVSIVGTGAGGWPGDLLPTPTPAPDTNVMSTTDGENYTLNNLVLTNGPIKFRQDYAWAKSWGGTAFPTGSPSGSDLAATAGTWNVTFVRSTGVYAFTAVALALNDFNAKSFSAYPNPTRNSWNIVSGNDDITSVQVFDMLGKSVYAKTTSSKEVNVNASTLSQGVYFARVSTAKGTSTVKLVKE
jgi:hypothetical protein